MVKRLKSQTETLLLLMMAIALAASLRLVFLDAHPPAYRDHGSSLSVADTSLQSHLDGFRGTHRNRTQGTILQSQYHPSGEKIPPRNADPSEPFPIVIQPYHGSVDPFYNIASDGTNLWDDDSILPAWMKAYFNWHKYKRKFLRPETWGQERWMVIQCLTSHDRHHCGGAADRLKPLPTLLRIAYENHRFLIIRWTRPATLETFLVPPKGGVDWRTPDWLAVMLEDLSFGKRFVPSKVIRRYAQTNLTVLRTRYQSDSAGKDIYNSARYPQDNDPSFEQVFGPLWRLFFRPSPAIAAILEVQLRSNGLVPGQYVSSHLRALYQNDAVPLPLIRRMAHHAVNCASMLRPGAPIFFASDSSNATHMVQTYAIEKNATLIVHVPTPNPPLHIDRDREWRSRQPSDYFDTFVDLYLLALAGCVVYTEGGYGHWGLLIGGTIMPTMTTTANSSTNSSSDALSSFCAINAQFVKRTRVFKTDCTWKDHDHHDQDGAEGGGTQDDAAAAAVVPAVDTPPAPLFPEPMP